MTGAPRSEKSRILYFDIEVSPTKGWAYDKWDASVIGVDRRSVMFSIAWKWKGEGSVHCLTLADLPTFRRDPLDDRDLVRKAWELLDQADLVVAHNGDGFDLKKLRTLFIYHGMTPPSPFRSVDTLKVARRQFKFFGNSLDDLCAFLGIGGKVDTGKGLWRECYEATWRDPSPYRRMARYNRQDVRLLEAVYRRMLPWVPKHPHVDPRAGDAACSSCGSRELQRRGTRLTVKGKVHRLQCKGCGRWTDLKPIPFG